MSQKMSFYSSAPSLCPQIQAHDYIYKIGDLELSIHRPSDPSLCHLNVETQEYEGVCKSSHNYFSAELGAESNALDPTSTFIHRTLRLLCFHRFFVPIHVFFLFLLPLVNPGIRLPKHVTSLATQKITYSTEEWLPEKVCQYFLCAEFEDTPPQWSYENVLFSESAF